MSYGIENNRPGFECSHQRNAQGYISYCPRLSGHRGPHLSGWGDPFQHCMDEFPLAPEERFCILSSYHAGPCEWRLHCPESPCKLQAGHLEDHNFLPQCDATIEISGRRVRCYQQRGHWHDHETISFDDAAGKRFDRKTWQNLYPDGLDFLFKEAVKP